MRQKCVMGNWKMHGSFSSIQSLLKQLTHQVQNVESIDLVLFPPAIYLAAVRDQLTGSSFSWGGQNVYPAEAGAFTGELAGPMLKEFGCQYVLVGHSERRMLFGESNTFIAQKFRHAKECGIIPVLCIGETLEQRQQGQTEEVLTQQLDAVYELGEVGFSESIIAYEPVWAIGTGKTATPDQVQAAHHLIRNFISRKEGSVAEKLQIIYGGSVTPETASELFALDDVDGGLVGGASLVADRFMDIIRCIN
jgi:triosephosphate isomerase (TIM)